MSIQFQCTGCDRLLQVPDGSAGRLASCQSCGTTMTIPGTPESSAPTELVAAGSTELPHEEENPYAAPGDPRAPWQPSPDFRGPSSITPTTIYFAQVISRAWRIYLKRFGKLLLAQLVSGLALVGSILAFQLAIGAGVVAVGPAVLLVMLLLPLVAVVAAVSVLLGQIQFTLKIARGEPAALRDLFSAIGGVPSYLVATLIFVVMTNIGYLFCFIPGIYLTLTFGTYPFPLVDRSEGPFACLESAALVSKGNRLSLLALYLFAGAGFMIVGACGMIVGAAGGGALDPEEHSTLMMAVMAPAMFLLWPFVLLVQTVAYLTMAGQPVIDPDASVAAPAERS